MWELSSWPTSSLTCFWICGPNFSLLQTNSFSSWPMNLDKPASSHKLHQFHLTSLIMPHPPDGRGHKAMPRSIRPSVPFSALDRWCYVRISVSNAFDFDWRVHVRGYARIQMLSASEKAYHFAVRYLVCLSMQNIRSHHTTQSFHLRNHQLIQCTLYNFLFV